MDFVTLLIGLDLSVKMLELSIEKKCYNLLVSCDVTKFLDQMIRDKSREGGRVVSISDESGMKVGSSEIENVNSIKEVNLYNTFTGTSSSTSAQYPAVIAAADVFVYIGNLSPIFSRACQILRNNDVLIFTVEENVNVNNNIDASTSKEDDGWFLQKSGRFAHSERYIRKLIEAECIDLKIVSLEKITPRYENELPIKGMLVTVMKMKEEGS